MHRNFIGGGYTKDITSMENWKATVDFICEALTLYMSKGFEFDTIVCRGHSGLIVAPAVAARLNKSFLFIRKPSDKNHSYCLGEGEADVRKYVILDDFSCSGQTIAEIIHALHKIETQRSEFIGKSTPVLFVGYNYRIGFGRTTIGVNCYVKDDDAPGGKVPISTRMPLLAFVSEDDGDITSINGEDTSFFDSPAETIHEWLQRPKTQIFLNNSDLGIEFAAKLVD